MMWSELKRELFKECANSIEPRVLLPTWKALIVDMVTVFTLGLCRWRWNGVTVKEFGDGFTSVEFICDKSVHSDPEAMKLVHEAAEEFGAHVVKVDTLPPHLMPSGCSYASARATDRILSGLLPRSPRPPRRPIMWLPANMGSVIQPTEQHRPQDDGFTESMVLGYALNDGITGGLLGGSAAGGMIGDALNTSESDSDIYDSGSCDNGD